MNIPTYGITTSGHSLDSFGGNILFGFNPSIISRTIYRGNGGSLKIVGASASAGEMGSTISGYDLPLSTPYTVYGPSAFKLVMPNQAVFTAIEFYVLTQLAQGYTGSSIPTP